MTERERILIVDDDPSVIDLLGNILEPDFDLLVATDGEQALELAGQSTPLDLILMDIIMPGMDGFQVIKQFKKIQPISNTPVIFITARQEKEAEIMGLTSGAVDFISKPISPMVVLARVKTHLALHKQKIELERYQCQIELSEALLRTIIESSSDGIVVIDKEYKIPIYNKQFTDMWQIPTQLIDVGELKLLTDQCLQQLVGSEIHGNRVGKFLHSGSTEPGLLEFKDGRTFSYYSIPLDFNNNGENGRVYFYTDITKFKVVESELRILSSTDDLTELYNRRMMNEILAREYGKCLRYDYNIGLLIFDVDHFKQINDQHGHQAGDRVLKDIASQMKIHFRSVDFCCRFGGDEFVVIIPNTSVSGMMDAGQRFLDLISAQLMGGLQVKMCIGAASTHTIENMGSYNRLMFLADMALYQAKKEGRNRICLYGGDGN